MENVSFSFLEVNKVYLYNLFSCFIFATSERDGDECDEHDEREQIRGSVTSLQRRLRYGCFYSLVLSFQKFRFIKKGLNT